MAGENSMGWPINMLVAHASTRIARRNMFPGGLDKILKVQFSSSTWRVSEATIRRLYINSYGIKCIGNLKVILNCSTYGRHSGLT